MAQGLRISRKAGEKIYIGDDIVITIENTGANIGVRITAPQEVPIHRNQSHAAASRKAKK